MFQEINDKQLLLDIENVLAKLGLHGIQSVDELTGGASHRVFRVQLSKRTMMVKQLSPKMMSKPMELQYHINSQLIAKAITSDKIKTVLAHHNDTEDTIFKVNSNYYMVYDWMPFEKTNTVTKELCYVMGNTLAQIHNNKISFERDEPIRKENYRHFSSIELKKCFEGSGFLGLPLLFKIHGIQKKAFNSYVDLNSPPIVSHCDLTLRNVLWNKNEPIVIDWDAAGYINKEKDLMQTLLSWCIVNNCIDNDLMEGFMDGYFSGGGDIDRSQIENAYYSVFLEDIEYLQSLVESNRSIITAAKELSNRFKKSRVNIKMMKQYFNI